MNDSATPYTTHLRVGDHEWDVDSTDEPGYGPTAGVRFTWLAPQDAGWPTQHQPTDMLLGIVVPAGTDFDDVDQGTPVHFTFTPAGYATPLVTFGGVVRDLAGQPHELGMVYTLSAVDHLVRFQEEYSTLGAFQAADPLTVVWPELVQDANVNGGLGTTPAIADPFAGQTKPLAIVGGVVGTDFGVDASTWDVLTGVLAAAPIKAGATPLYQRGVLTYQLDGAGDLDTAAPLKGNWVTASPDSAPLTLALVGGTWTATGGNLDGDVVQTAAVEWTRQRVEPNVVVSTLAGGIVLTAERPHTGPDITREQSSEPRYLSGYVEPQWVLSGREAVDQWATQYVVVASEEPAVVAGWFTLPTAMQKLVALHGIDPRHTPDGSGRMVGMLAGATLTIPAGGRWSVAFTLRRALPDPSNPNTGGWIVPGAVTWDELPAGLTWNNIDPTITWDDLNLIGD